MKFKYLLTLVLLVLSAIELNAQVRVFSFKVQDQYLQNGKILIKNNLASTPIKIEIEFTTYRNNQGVPLPGSIKTRLATSNSAGQPIFLSTQQEVKHTDFKSDSLTLKKTYDILIDKSKLANYTIDLFTQPNGFSEGMYTSKRYQYVIETPAPVETEIADNVIQLSGDPNAVDKIQVSGLQPSGGNGNFNVTWHIVDSDDLPISSVEGVSSSLTSWTKNDSNYPTISSPKAVYVYRRLTSGSKVSISNKLMIMGPEIINNTISLSTALSDIENVGAIGSEVQGGNGTYQATWILVDENESKLTYIDGITTTTSTWLKDNINHIPIQNSGNVYLYRELTSSRRKSQSNRIVVSNWNGSYSSLNVNIKGNFVRYSANNSSFTLLPLGTEINANDLASHDPEAALVDNNLFLVPSQDHNITLTITNPVQTVNYRWHYMIENAAHVGFNNWGGDGPGLLGNSVISDALPRYGYNYNTVHIYGSDGSRLIVYLTTVNYVM